MNAIGSVPLHTTLHNRPTDQKLERTIARPDMRGRTHVCQGALSTALQAFRNIARFEDVKRGVVLKESLELDSEEIIMNL